MITIESLTEFFGWCAAINIGILLFTSLMIMGFSVPFSKLHGAMFKMPPEEVRSGFYNYLGQFKVATIVFSLVPYLALKAMG